MTKPIVVEVTHDTESYPKGAQLGFDSVAKAEKVLGDNVFKVVRYQDGSEYEAPKKSAVKTADKPSGASKDA